MDGEREVVLELIDMVEKIDENNLADASARRRQELRSAITCNCCSANDSCVRAFVDSSNDIW